MTAAAPALRISDLRKRFGAVVALDGVSLELAQGEALALIGESGSGKTTLMRSINRLVEPDSGRVEALGDDVTNVDPIALRRRMGYVPQDGGLLPHWSVLRNAALVPWLRGRTDAEDRARAALARIGLAPATFASRRPSELSGGQRQRVAIARALAGEPELLLLDEPFGALDAITRGELQESFAALRAQLAIALVLVTHDVREAIALADRVAVMRAGRIEQLSDVQTLVNAPATPYVKQLLARAGVA